MSKSKEILADFLKILCFNCLTRRRKKLSQIAITFQKLNFQEQILMHLQNMEP